MTKKKRGLGRGLDALLTSSRAAEVATLPDDAPAEDMPEEQAAVTVVDTDHSDFTDGELRHLPVEWIQPGQYQPRKDIQPEALEELAASIKSQGLMQPIVVRPLPAGENRYEIIAGERRWRASQLAQLDRVPALIRDVPDEAAIAMALIETSSAKI